MSNVDTQVWKSLETAGPVAFGLGGVALLTNVLLELVFSGAVPGWLNILLSFGGVWVGLIGLVGFYPLVAKPAPRLSLGGVVTGALGWVALTVGFGWAMSLNLTTQTTVAEGPPLVSQIVILAFVLALLSFLIYGITSVLTYSPSRTVGLLLLVPFLATLIGTILSVGSDVYGIDLPEGVTKGVAFALVGVTAVSMIAVGYALRTGYAPLDSTTSTDTTA